uniref:Uncharacterized protein n=1 Tax=Rhizophora mucronata TaxID=61149 RepID=A0A2P2R109_RHIMU
MLSLGLFVRFHCSLLHHPP